MGVNEEIALLQANIGEVHRKKGNFRKAQEYYQQSLAIYNELGNDPLIAWVLFELIWVALEKQDSNSVNQFLQELKEVNARSDNRVIDQRYRVAQALLLKSSKRTRQQMKAGEILEQVVLEEVGDHSLTVTAMIHLCDLLLSELKITGEDELIGDIKKLTNQLLEIAKKQSSSSILTETYLLQSKLAVVEMDLGRASHLLTQAQLIAEETGLDRISQRLADERKVLDSQIQMWDRIIKEHPSKQDMIALTKLDDLLERMIQETVTNLMAKKLQLESETKAKYTLIYLDLLKDPQKVERGKLRVGIAQIGLSKTGNILNEYYQEIAPGLFGLRNDKIPVIKKTLKKMVKAASSKSINILAFPELTIDLNNQILKEYVVKLATAHNMVIIPGSYHNPETRQNLSAVISPEGILWEQEKHIPAIIHFKKQKITEGIEQLTPPQKIIIANTEFGRIAIVICRDFLDLDLRVELKNSEPPVDIIINPAFTPVTADFKAAHFDARRSIYAYSFFVNVAEFGDSLIYSPEKERVERTISSGTEGLIFMDIDLFRLRSERKKWEIEQKKLRPFIQSTRH